jgi:glycosyltransferase involved in cell wall biosynthesis
MRLVHVTDTFLPKVGGAEIAIDQLIRAMVRSGDECALLAQRRAGMAKEIEAPYRIRRFANPRSSLWAGWWIERHLRKLVAEFGKPDAIIAHHAFPPGYAAVNVGRRLGVPCLVYPRGGDIYEVSRFRRKKHAWRKLTWALQNASAVICASAAMEQLVREIMGSARASQRIVRIPNGVDIADLRRDASESRFANDPKFVGPFVLAIGRAIRRKGFHLLIEAWEKLPANEWKLVIAGDGRELEALREQAAGLGDRVIFTGMVAGADKRWLLQHCQFMAAPSLEESFGNVALEAMACGKPAIASHASGFAEIVVAGENGLLVEVGNVPSLGQALSRTIGMDRSRMSQAAGKTAKKFGWDVIVDKYHGVIGELAGGDAN